MKAIGFNSDMQNILKTIIGKNNISIEYVGNDINQAFGNLVINTNEKIIEISNIEDMNGFDEEYDSSHFSCKFVDNYIPILKNKNLNKNYIKDTITDINIIYDIIDIDEYNLHIKYDMGLEIVTEEHKYLISRGYFYSEIIDINIDSNLDDVYSIKKVVEDYQNEDNSLLISVKRLKKKIKERREK